MKYRVVVEPGAERDIRRLAADVRARVLRAAMALGDDPRPHGYRKLAGRGEQYRIRVGDYRVIYDIRDAVLVVLVIEVGHRSSIY